MNQMSESMYAFLSNIQIASLVLSALCFTVAIVAIVFAIITMFYAIKALKLYVANHTAPKMQEDNGTTLDQCQAQIEESSVKENEETPVAEVEEQK